MALFGLLKPKYVLSPPRLRLVVFAAEETLPTPFQLTHPDRLWNALPGVPVALKQRLDARLLLEQPMESGNYLFKGPHGDVLACVEERLKASPYPGRDPRRSSGSPAGLGPAERARLEAARWMVTLEMAEVVAEAGDVVLYQVELADRLAALAEGAVLDRVAHRYYLPGRWRVANALKPLDAREHVVLHLEIQDTGNVWVHTHGLAKFGRPEMEVLDLPPVLGEPACRLLMDLAQRLVGGAILRPGARVGDVDTPLIVRPGTEGSATHCGGQSLELVDVGPDRKPATRGALRGVEAYRRPPDALAVGAR